MTRIALAVAFLLVATFSACGPPPPPSTTATRGTDAVDASPDVSIDLRLAGSSILGERLMPALLEAYIDSRGGRSREWIDDEGGRGRRLRVRESGGASVPLHVSIVGQNSDAAFQALARGEADIGMASRLISASELFSLSSRGDFKDARSEHLVALDGLAVIVNAANPVRGLTVEQITEIFSCRITDWSEVGGSPGTITLYAREGDSEIRQVFEVLALAPEGLSDCPPASQLPSSGELSQAVSSDPRGIGVVGLSHVQTVRAVDIIECDRTASAPNAFTVRSGEYSLARPLYLYTPAEPGSPFVHDLIDFILSPMGQEIVHKEGVVTLDVRPDMADPQDRRLAEAVLHTRDADMLSKLIGITRGAVRLAVTFRFERGGDLLDELGVGDIDRLARTLKSQAWQGRELMLLGFTDDRGDDRDNLRLSRRRAESVAQALRERGATVGMIRGFGQEAPVACNSNERGAARNRRVEVWIR
ncbi:MAG TPA: phosphate ABC transporter substrate-binding/OmpA family protein [Thermoanaerobaculia bacterium]|nr:phosphate ABC transporter substrate-binding/OmpA family protein [Thermoanaerobaculia bacterium]